MKSNRIVRVIVIIIVALATSVFLYLLINNFQFSRGVSIRVHFTNIGDLNTGAWVRKAGIKVGSVTGLTPAEDEKTVIVKLTFRPGQIVRVTDKFSIVAKGILGDVYIEQLAGPKSSALAQEGQLFEGQPFFSISDLLGGDTMGMVSDVASGIKDIVALLKKNEGSLDSSIRDIQKTAENVRIVTDRAVRLTDSVPDLSGQITTSMDQLQATVNDVAATTHRLVARMETNLGTSSDDLAASMKSIRKTSQDIQGAVDALTAQKSVLSTLSSPQVSQSLDATVKNLEEISKSLLAVSRDTEKIVQGVRVIIEQK
ncbi:MAG TPA: MlaD family protein [Spirochaetia bacterium]|nr:MlaD family protein [Spirochaetia bacterium]